MNTILIKIIRILQLQINHQVVHRNIVEISVNRLKNNNSLTLNINDKINQCLFYI